MKSLAYLNKYIWRYKFRLLFGILFIIASNLFAIYPAQIIREAFNVVQKEIAPETLNSPDDMGIVAKWADGFSLAETLIFFAVLVVFMSLMKGVFTFFTRQTIIIMSRLVEYDLKNSIYTHYQVLSPTFYRSNDTGDIMNRISEDVTRVRMYLGPGIMYSLNLVVLFTLVISTMLSINVKLTLFSLLPLPVLSVIIYFVSNIINRKSEEVQSQLSNISSAAQESFSGIRLLKAFVREANAIHQYNEKSIKYKELALSLVKVESIFMPVMMLLVGLSTILTIYIGGKEAIAGRIEIGNIAEFVIYVNMLTWPVTAIGWVTSLTQRAAASQQRINEFLQTEENSDNNQSNESALEGNLSFEKVGFTYSDSGIEALHDISFNLKEGNTLGVIGRTGSGKSTLVELLCRKLNPTTGEIKLDGKNYENLNLNSVRSQMGVVPQEAFLFSDTIRNNISFGSNEMEVSQEQITSAAESAEILKNIESFPNGFDTLVGERGITLSGGQKQRISIARAFIRDPKIAIFDDCLSAVDTVTEKKILKNLKSYQKKKTMVIVSHRVSTVQHADEIILLEGGKIIERGKHKELIQKRKQYFEMFEQQKLEEEEIPST